MDEHYDTGRILAQRVVCVLPDDTAEELAARVLQEVLDLIYSLSVYLQCWSASPLSFIDFLCVSLCYYDRMLSEYVCRNLYAFI